MSRLCATVVSVWAAAAFADASRPPALPLGVSKTLYSLAVPTAPSAEQIALGETLFNDKRLSADDSTSCATCHDPTKAFTDGKKTAEGLKKQVGTRNSPTVLNAMFNQTQFWDGRAASLEEQARLPILNPIEMGMASPDAVVAKLKGLPEYPARFQKVFGRELTYDDLSAAIAAFERTHFSGTARFDRFIAGDPKALSAAEQRGWALFNGKARCNACHMGNQVNPLFSDQGFHNIGVAALKQDFAKLASEAVGIVRSADARQIDQLALESKFSELGRFLVSKSEGDVGAFKTPALRNVAVTGPYMHDGSFATLWDVIDHYNKGGVPNPFLDGGMQRLGLSEKEIDDLVAFLASLTSDEYQALEKRELARQAAAKGKRPERDTAVALGKQGHVGDLAPDPTHKNPAELGSYGVPLEK